MRRVIVWTRRAIAAFGVGAMWALVMMRMFGESIVVLIVIIPTSLLITGALSRFWAWRDNWTPRLAPMRLRRHCYDKPHRCPGWAGGGIRFPKDGTGICESASFLEVEPDMYSKRLWSWRFHKCRRCGTVATPYVTRYLDPTWWRHIGLWRWKRRFLDWRDDRKEART